MLSEARGMNVKGHSALSDVVRFLQQNQGILCLDFVEGI